MCKSASLSPMTAQRYPQMKYFFIAFRMCLCLS